MIWKRNGHTFARVSSTLAANPDGFAPAGISFLLTDS
jgi:phage tail protein X